MTDSVHPISIPDQLLPSDGRFGSGPSKVRPEAVRALAAAADRYLGTSHRREGVRNVVGRIRDGLNAMYALPEGYEVLLGVGGATAFWDAAAAGLIERRSQHLVFGEFSSKFAAVVRSAPHLDAPDVIESEYGTHPEPVGTSGVDAYAFCHNETSTGVAMAITRPDGADEPALVLVDATSAAGGVGVDPREFDVYYFSPQKCFGADAGTWIALCSPAGIDRIERIASGTATRWIPTSINLLTALENSRKNQTYNTPSLAGLFLLADTVDWFVDSGGLDWAADRCATSAETIYGWAEKSEFAAPFVSNPADRSTTVATIDFVDDVDAGDVAATLRANGIVDTEPYRKLGRNQLRVALFPAVEPDDVDTLTHAIDHVVEHL